MNETKCRCGSRVDQSTDGIGNVRDVCSRTGLAPERCSSVLRNGVNGSNTVTLAGSKCKVKDCPGVLDAAGSCACCAKRDAWAEANIPKRRCGICGGTITGKGARKFCGACGPVAKRAAIAGWKGEHAAPRATTAVSKDEPAPTKKRIGRPPKVATA